jgi:HK97 gp10 family phage protein
MSRRSGFRWSSSPGKLGTEVARRVAKIELAMRALAAAHAARAEGAMKSNAPWMDQTAFARGSLYGRAEGTDIILGTTNAEYGIFLELGTVNMAPRPVIRETLDQTAQAYFRDAVALAGGILGG